MTSAPNFCAWAWARPASSRPEIPVGNPGQFSIFELEPACPPGELASITSTSSPSEAAYGGRKTRWSAADDDDIAPVDVIDPLIEAETVGDLLIAGILQHRLAAADHDRYLRRLHVKSDRAIAVHRRPGQDRGT
jgi:hypothetical protein